MLNRKDAVVTVNATAKQYHEITNKRKLRLPIGKALFEKGAKVDVYCPQGGSFQQLVVKKFIVLKNHVLVEFCK